MKRLILTVGLPRSGKSTYALSLGYPIVSPDAVRIALHGRKAVGAGEGWVWAMARSMVQALFAAGHDAVIVDTMNGLRKYRARWTSEDWICEWHQLNVGVERCVERAKAQGDAYLEAQIENMARSWEPVQPYEGKALSVPS